jgi:hypothetical protein
MAFRVDFDSLIAWPKGAPPGQLVIPLEMPLTAAQEKPLFDLFDRLIKQGEDFKQAVTVPGSPALMTVRFLHFGPTSAAFFVSVGQPEQLTYCCTALLTRLDKDTDRFTIEQVCTARGGVPGIAAEKYDQALDLAQPVAATFFSHHRSVQFAPVITVNKLVSAAYFSQFGIGSEASAQRERGDGD